MKLIYIHQYFVTNEGTSGTRSYDVSKYLVQMGHQVTMITGLHDQDSRVRLPWWRLFMTTDIDGIRVIYCNARYSNSMKVPGRLWSFVKFAILATWVALRQRRADLIFATSTPLTVGIPGRVAAALKGLPYVFEVRDLWPEDLLAADRIKPGLQFKLWEMLERFCYAKARKILLVSKGFHDRLIERGFDPAKLQTIVLGADGSLFADAKPDTAYLREHGLEGKTIAVYTGAHGDANGLPQILDAAEHLRHRSNIAIVLIGQGKMRDGLIADAARRGLTNVRFLPAVPKHQLPNILTACHIGLMILKQITRPRWVTPNKIFDYMFAGLPSIVNFPGTTADLVVDEGVGVAAKPGDARDLAAKIEHWADRPQERAAIGQKARDVAWKKFDRKMIAKSLADVFESIGGQPPPADDRAV
jgi:glycosyltransferase involved in cell wall biosynthesis